MNELLRQGKILFGDDHTKIVELKVYASEYQEKLARACPKSREPLLDLSFSAVKKKV
jgi:hypothetical protein